MFDSVHYEMQDTHIILIPDGEFVGLLEVAVFFSLSWLNAIQGQ